MHTAHWSVNEIRSITAVEKMSLSPVYHQLEEYIFNDDVSDNAFLYDDDVSKTSPSYQELNFNTNSYSDMNVTNDQFIGGNSNQPFDWRQPETWSTFEVRSWLQSLSSSCSNEQVQPDRFADVDGRMLVNMTLNEFVARDPHCGEYLYYQLQPFLSYIYAPTQSEDYQTTDVDVRPRESLDSVAELMRYYIVDGNEKLASLQLLPSISTFSQVDQTSTVKNELKAEPQSPPPPSPTESVTSNASTSSSASKKHKKKGKLWEFMRDLLLNKEHNPTIIKWEDRSSGVFRIVRSEKVAELWGIRKCNSTMTYEKLSRALRYYYKKSILERIDGRRLVYKFGPNSKGWQL